MAAEEVIHFPFWAQLSTCPCSPALSPPEPVVESPPELKTGRIFVPSRATLSRSTIRVSHQHSEHCSETAIERRNPKSGPLQRKMVRKMNKADAFGEIYLWNLNMDRLIRVLQRLEIHSFDRSES
jgi:hypothetical protein